jgi:hypothetical protein
MPIGAFLLIRKNGQIGAIRLTSIDPTATEYFGKSSYESYFPGDSLGSFRSGNSTRQSNELDVRPSKGTRGIYYQPGRHKARIGDWAFVFEYPTWMAMSSITFWEEHKGYEFAPTSACDISEVDANDKRLRWFRDDPNAEITLQLVDLPK